MLKTIKPPIVSIKRNETVYQFFPRNLSVFLQPLTRSYDIINNLVINCECKDITSRDHLNHVPILAINDSNPKIAKLAKILLEEPNALFDILLSNSIRKDQELANFFFKLTSSHPDQIKSKRQIQHLIRKMQIIQYYNEDYQAFIQRGIDNYNHVFLYLEPPLYTEDSIDFDYYKLYNLFDDLPITVQWLLNCNDHEFIKDLSKNHEFEFIQREQTNMLFVTNNLESFDYNSVENILSSYQSVLTG